MSDGQTIAVGFDGSPGGIAALRWSVLLANQLGIEVVVVHAVGMLERVQNPQSVRDLKEAAMVLASEVVEAPTQVRWHVSEADPCSALLQSIVPPIAADLIVVGSRGHTLDSALPLGSTSLEVAQHSRVPVVIIPTH